MIGNLCQFRSHEIIEGFEAKLGGRGPFEIVRGQWGATELKLAHRTEALLCTNERPQIVVVYFLIGNEAFGRLYSIILSEVNDFR